MSTRHAATPSVVTAGYTPLDVIRAQGATQWKAGGTAANVAAILAYLGWEAAIAGETGSDVAGNLLVEDLDSAGVEVSCLSRAAGPAARLVHDIGLDGHQFRFVCPQCGQRLPRNRPLRQAGAERCLDRHPRPSVYFFDRATAATVWLAERYGERGALIVFEPSIAANAQLLARATAAANVIKYSDDRAVGSLDEIAVAPRDGQLRVVTHGAAGVELSVGDKTLERLPAFPARVVDAGGAGDWTTAGMLFALGGRRPPTLARLRDAVRLGQALAALSCSAAGARGITRRRPATLRAAADRLIAGGHPRLGYLRPAVAAPPGRHAEARCRLCLLQPATVAHGPRATAETDEVRVPAHSVKAAGPALGVQPT